MTEREAWEAFERAFDEGTWKAISTAARDLVKAARAEALTGAAKKMQEIAASRGHTGSKSVALFVAWCEGKEPHE